MARDYWNAGELRAASRLLSDAADNLDTSYPHSTSRPRPTTLPAVLAMIEAAQVCIEAAKPEHSS